MEIRRWHYYVIFNCVLMRYLEAKTFSLNDVIAAESQPKQTSETSLLPKLSAGVSKRNPLIKRPSTTSRVRKFLESDSSQDSITPGDKTISPLKYKKTFQIKSPLKPKKLNLIQKSRYKRKNQSAKREINGNEKLKHKYIPLLKSLSMLFDNLLGSDTSESLEINTKKYKRNRFYSEETFRVPCNCTDKFDYRNSESKSQEKTVTTSPSLTTETSVASKNLTFSETTSTTADYTSARDFSAFRQNKNIPVLLPRNTFSSRRNDNGISEGSGSTLHRNTERNITRHHGDHEHTTGCGKNESCKENDEKDTYGDTRNDARGFRYPGTSGNRNNTPILSKGNGTDEVKSKNETTDDDIPKNQFENRRDETKSAGLLQEPIRRLRGFTSNDVNQNAERVQPAETVHKESVINPTHDNAGYKRIIDGSSPVATEDQKIRERNETMTFDGDNTNLLTSNSKTPSKKSPVVMIFDGYSITRHKNGENKFLEKSIRIHS